MIFRYRFAVALLSIGALVFSTAHAFDLKVSVVQFSMSILPTDDEPVEVEESPASVVAGSLGGSSSSSDSNANSHSHSDSESTTSTNIDSTNIEPVIIEPITAPVEVQPQIEMSPEVDVEPVVEPTPIAEVLPQPVTESVTSQNDSTSQHSSGGHFAGPIMGAQNTDHDFITMAPDPASTDLTDAVEVHAMLSDTHPLVRFSSTVSNFMPIFPDSALVFYSSAVLGEHFSQQVSALLDIFTKFIFFGRIRGFF